MPIFFQQDIDGDTRLGIWKIEEEEAFFLKQVPLQREITHPHKRLQHLAGRYLLKHLFPDFPLELIRIADTRKPFLENEAYHFSISHCSDFAAVVASRVNRVGIDIEIISPKTERIKHKFISEGEWNRVDGVSAFFQGKLEKDQQLSGSPSFWVNHRQPAKENRKITENRGWATSEDAAVPTIILSTLLWSCKEAAFKWYGLGGVDFREHMVVQHVIPSAPNWFKTILIFRKMEEVYLNVESCFFEELCMSYLVT